jgi:hypothetical protein
VVRRFLAQYARLPFAGGELPGAMMEWLLAQLHGASVLKNYDFVDVIHAERRMGWQVKSTKASTPITWKRAKLPDKVRLIEASEANPVACQKLGAALIDFCNAHAAESFRKHPIDAIGYARLVMRPGGQALYFERALCTRRKPEVFSASDFVWHWSHPKKTAKKEQLSALHGVHRASGQKWFAWHGRGENQLHFSGEAHWWPRQGRGHAVAINLPAAAGRLSLAGFVDLFEAASATK